MAKPTPGSAHATAVAPRRTPAGAWAWGAALLLAAGTAVSAQSITTGFSGSSSLSGEWNGNFFDVTARNPGGITINSWQIHSSLSAGSPLTVRIYYKQGTWVGLHNDISAWTLLGEVPAVSNGWSTGTPVNLGGLNIPHDAIYGIRIGVSGGTLRYHSNTQIATPVLNDDIRLDLGGAQATLFGATVAQPRGWNGTIHYTAHGAVVQGACCLPSGACALRTQLICTNEGGTYHGDNTQCSNTPPGGCPQPPTGACCLENGTCTITWVVGCHDARGLYRGDGTTCANPCPLGLAAHWDGTNTATASGVGMYFLARAVDPAGIAVDGFTISSLAPAGTPLTVHVYHRPVTFVGYTDVLSAWTLMGQVQTVAAGPGKPTPVLVNGLQIPGGETWALRVGITGSGGLLTTSQAATIPVFSNPHLELHMGELQNSFFASATFGAYPAYMRGWNGTLFYRLGANIATGSCCFPDGTCGQHSQAYCIAARGTYHGDGTTCATTPSGGCPQPPPAPPVEWTAMAPAPEARSRAAGALVGDTFYFMGGESDGGQRNTTAWKLDLNANVWTPVANLPHNGVGNGGVSNVDAAAIDGSIYIVGGWDGAAASNRVLRYDIALDQWQQVFSDPLPEATFGSAVLARAGKLYVIGGCSAVGTTITQSWIYDPAAPAGSRWTSFAALPRPRCLMAAAVIGNHIWVAGSSTGSDARQVDRYDLTTGVWTTMPDLADLRGGPGLYAVGSHAVVVSGGWNAQYRTTEFFGGQHWHYASEVVSAARTFAYDGNAQWLVKAGGWRGGNYTADTEVAQLSAPCYANCDGSTQPPILNVADFTCFLQKFAAGHPYANCDASTQPPVLNVADFTCFLQKFAAGCP